MTFVCTEFLGESNFPHLNVLICPILIFFSYMKIHECLLVQIIFFFTFIPEEENLYMSRLNIEKIFNCNAVLLELSE